MKKAHIIKFDQQYSPIICEIRQTVFTLEQSIDADADLDGLDPLCLHILIEKNNKMIATERMQKDGHIGRLAVLKPYRQSGVGTKILQMFFIEARKMGLKYVYLGAQEQAVAFYEKLEFERYGEEFMEEGITHVLMRRLITSAPPQHHYYLKSNRSGQAKVLFQRNPAQSKSQK